MNTLVSQNSQSWLSWFLKGLLVLLTFILVSKLIEVQLIKGSHFRKLSEENRIRHVPLPAARGRILSSDGTPLADNVSLKKRAFFRGNGTIEISEDLTNAKEDEVITDYKRVYTYGSVFAHSSGYLSVVSEKEIGKIDPKCPEKGIKSAKMLVGVAGLEKEYDCKLQGVAGEQLVEVDSIGNRVRILAIKPPIPGSDIKTTIDIGLQKKLAEFMEESKEGKKGAAILTSADGKILAAYSKPSYDPNLFIDRNDSAKISSLLNDSDLPLFNRTISGTYHPGSVFKPVVALAALETGAIDKNYKYDDPGVITINGFSYNNWYFTEYGRREGTIGLSRAIARSTDTFFYKIGELTGPVNLAKWADDFGLNKRTGVDIPGETFGLIPTPDWKQKTKHESWFLGNTYNMSIGQGDVAVTPMEINTYIAAISADGKYCKPSYVENVSSDCNQIKTDQKNIDQVKEGMIEACKEGGTAYTFFDFPKKHNDVSVACKTGTAEVGADDVPHAWFTLFAPANNPEIVATVFFEKGGQGSQVAGPVARKILDYYYDRAI